MPATSPARLLAALACILLWLLLCLWARRQARRREAAVRAATALLDAPPGDAILVAHASQTGHAADLAEQTAQSLRAAGLEVRLAELGQLHPRHLLAYRQALFVASTYGEGDAPDSAAAFVAAMDAVGPSDPALSGLSYAILAPGDRTYANYCGFARRLDAWLLEHDAQPIWDLIEIDRGDPAAVRLWQEELGRYTGAAAAPRWEEPAYESWRLASRVLLNPGSQGGACFHLVLEPPAGTAARWQAGDLAEIQPLDPRSGQPLPPREYSIASMPSDGAVHLLVRQALRPDGTLGAGSGWLTEHAPIGGTVALRLRTNRNFHPPADDRPLILIGNGTGLAGLRALVKARIESGRRRNWLLFGERNAAHDWFHADDIERWLAEGFLAHVDAVFSRDQPERRYVQHRLAELAERLREWVADGAAIYVCGSLQGMAGGVDAALRAALGSERVDALQRDGRYRRDVY